MKKFGWGLIFLAIVLSLLTSCGKDKEPPVPEVPGPSARVITIGTDTTTPLSHITALSIAKIAEQKLGELGCSIVVKATTGVAFNIDAVKAGDLDFAVVRSDKLYHAIRGFEEWEDKGPQSELLAVFTIHPESVCLVAADDAGIDTVQDLRGKRVNIGRPGSHHRQSAIHALTSAGLDLEEDLKALGTEAAQGARMLQEEQADAFFYAAEHPDEVLKAATTGRRKVHFVPITEVKRLLLNYPYYVRTEIPVNQYPGASNREEVLTFGFKATLVTSAKVPKDIVYAVTGEVFDNLDRFKKDHPSHQRLTRINMTEGMYRMIHRGALAYYMRNGFRLSCCF